MTLIPYEHIEIRENNERLVALSADEFFLEPRYFHAGYSRSDAVLARETIQEKLRSVQHALAPYRLKVWDAWRPRSVQQNIYDAFWKEVIGKHADWDDDRVAHEVETFCTVADDPKRVPPHATGGTVDLTLCTASGDDVDMGTDFDHLGPEAASLYYEERKENRDIRDHRRLLREAMVAEGFRKDDGEWWHYDYGNQLWAMSEKKPYAISGEANEELH